MASEKVSQNHRNESENPPESADPYETDDPGYVEYHKLNGAMSKVPGQLRVRVQYRNYVTAWLEYLLVSKQEMQNILRRTSWRLTRTINAKDAEYLGVIEKER